jgi:FeS assembly SUF system regulator
MLRLAKLTDYGVLAMTALAASPQEVCTAQQLAARTRIAAPTIAKLLKQLTRGGLVESVRGAHGGYRLRRAPESVTVAEVVGALEGPIGITECTVHGGGCGIESSCAARANWRLINAAIREGLEAITLAQMAAPLRAARTSEQSPLVFHPQTPHPASGRGAR